MDGLNRRTFLAAAGLASSTAALAPAAESSPDQPYDPNRDPLLISQNLVIIKGRDAALEVLQPSQANLHRGLELHRRSLVFDTYGFAPRAASYPPDLTALVEAGASDVELQDLQEEQSMLRAATVADERTEFEEATDRNRVSGGGVTAGIDFGLVLLAKLLGEDIAKVTQLALEYDPAPPFDAGTPKKAGPAVMKKMQEWLGQEFDSMTPMCVAAGKKMGDYTPAKK